MAIVFDLVCVATDLNPDAVTRGLATSRVLTVRPANPSEIAKFPTALTAVEFNYISGNSSRVATFLSSTATATVKTNINT